MKTDNLNYPISVSVYFVNNFGYLFYSVRRINGKVKVKRYGRITKKSINRIELYLNKYIDYLIIRLWGDSTHFYIIR